MNIEESYINEVRMIVYNFRQQYAAGRKAVQAFLGTSDGLEEIEAFKNIDLPRNEVTLSLTNSYLSLAEQLPEPKKVLREIKYLREVEYRIVKLVECIKSITEGECRSINQLVKDNGCGTITQIHDLNTFIRFRERKSRVVSYLICIGSTKSMALDLFSIEPYASKMNALILQCESCRPRDLLSVMLQFESIDPPESIEQVYQFIEYELDVMGRDRYIYTYKH